MAAAAAAAAIEVTGAVLLTVRLGAIGVRPLTALGLISPGQMLAVGVAPVGVTIVCAVAAVCVTWALARRSSFGRSVAASTLAASAVVLSLLTFDATPGERTIGAVMIAVAGATALLFALLAARRAWVDAHGRAVALTAALSAVAAVGVLIAAGEEIVALGVAGLLVTLAVAVALAATPARWRRHRLLAPIVTAGAAVRLAAAPFGVLLLAALLWLDLNTWAIAVLVVLAALLAWGLIVSLRRAHSLPVHALLVFLAVMGFGMALTVLHDVEQPGVRAFAMRAGDSEVLGILVGRTHSSLLVAQGRHCTRNRDLQLVSGRLTGRVRLLQIDTHLPGWLPEPHAGPLRDVFDRAGKLLNALREKAGLQPYPVRPSCASEGILDATVRKSTPVVAPLAGRLAERFRPLLEFDRSERWRPLDVDRFLSERIAGAPAHRLCGTTIGCLPLTDPAQLAGATGFIDIAGEKLGGDEARSPALAACPGQPDDLPLLDCDGGPASAIYYHAVSANGRIYIDYWWFLRYNHFARADAPQLCRGRVLSRLNRLGALTQVGCYEHEGDWEGVTVVTRVHHPRELEFVDFAEHEDVLRHRVSALEMRGQRPLVYVADGSHATYPAACAHACHQEYGRMLGGPRLEDDRGGTEGWARNPPAACDDSVAPCLLSLDAETWATFKGLWGSAACTSGRAACQLGVAPATPAQQRRFRIPWCYRDTQTGWLECDPVSPPAAQRR